MVYRVGANGYRLGSAGYTLSPPQASETWTILESFESASWTDDWDSTTGWVQATDVTPIDGTYTARYPGPDSYEGMYSKSTSSISFPKGKIYRAFVRTDYSGVKIRTLFGSSGSNDHYYAQLDLSNDTFALYINNGGAVTNFDVDYGITPTVNTWYLVKIIRDDGTLGGNDNDIIAEVWDETETTLLASCTANDSTFAANDDIGFVIQSLSGDPSYVWVDAPQIMD